MRYTAEIQLWNELVNWNISSRYAPRRQPCTKRKLENPSLGNGNRSSRTYTHTQKKRKVRIENFEERMWECKGNSKLDTSLDLKQQRQSLINIRFHDSGAVNKDLNLQFYIQLNPRKLIQRHCFENILGRKFKMEEKNPELFKVNNCQFSVS